MVNWIKRKTFNLRKRVCCKLMKHFVPSEYSKIALLNLVNEQNYKWIHNVPRPSILYMKEYFENNPVVGCEIGVQQGINSESILKELNVRQLILIDSWDIAFDVEGENYFNLVCSKFMGENRVNVCKCTSIKASKLIPDFSLDFVYIDANHEYQYVMEDLCAWVPKVKNGGIVAGHDILNYIGVIRAIKQFCILQNVEFFVSPPDWYFVKNF